MDTGDSAGIPVDNARLVGRIKGASRRPDTEALSTVRRGESGEAFDVLEGVVQLVAARVLGPRSRTGWV